MHCQEGDVAYQAPRKRALSKICAGNDPGYEEESPKQDITCAKDPALMLHTARFSSTINHTKVTNGSEN